MSVKEQREGFQFLTLGDIKEASDLRPHTIIGNLSNLREIDEFFALFLRLKYGRRALIASPRRYFPDELLNKIYQGRLTYSQIPSRLLDRQRVRPDIVHFKSYAASIVPPDYYSSRFVKDTIPGSASQVILRGKLFINHEDKPVNLGEITRHFLFTIPTRAVAGSNNLLQVFTERRNLDREEEIMRVVNELCPVPDLFTQAREVSDALATQARKESIKRAALAEDGVAYYSLRHPASIGLGSLGKRS